MDIRNWHICAVDADAGLFCGARIAGVFSLHCRGDRDVWGGLLLLGLFTRAAAVLLAIEMCVAIWKVHSAHGYLAVSDYQFPLSLAAACFALATVGAGLISVDQFCLRRAKSESAEESE